MATNKPNKIILHCTATKEGQDFRAKDVDLWHKQKGWIGIGYHYLIDLDGKVEKGRDESVIGAHCYGKNTNSLGICYVGGLDKNGKEKDTRTDAQKSAMLDLVYLIVEKYHLTIKDVYCHNQFDSKACPCFTIQAFREEYEKAFGNK